MLCAWVLSFFSTLLYAWVSRLFPDLHVIHVGFKLCRCFRGSSLCCAHRFKRFSSFKYAICVDFKVISRSTCYTCGF